MWDFLRDRIAGFRRPCPDPPTGWDAAQQEIIAARTAARLLVDGGPGTGKTAIACARVGHLVRREGIAPSAIRLISFTRTAIREIRDRIGEAVGDGDLARDVRISTLDSLAWDLEPDPERETSYDDSIRRALELVRTDDDARRGLAELAHLVIDEAHDIVGIRADLIVAVIEALSPTCGVTVFADDAQAIYGFAERGWGGGALIERLGDAPAFRPVRLRTVFRARSPALMRLFTDGRDRVLRPHPDPARLLAKVRRDVERVGGRAPDGDADLVLFRSRAEVLRESARWHDRGIGHRLRMSGHPVALAPWLAAALGGYFAPVLSEGAFAGLWRARVENTPFAIVDAAEAWRALVRLAPHGLNGVNMARLRHRLAASQPPAEFCLPEIGMAGPVLGTIHASKGREADVVRLMLPPVARQRGNPAEEARTLFVGATRARNRLLVGQAEPVRAFRLPSGRVWQSAGAFGSIHVEFGLAGDIVAEGLAGTRFFASPADVEAAQTRLLAARAFPTRLAARPGAAPRFAFRIAADDDPGPATAVFSEAVVADLDALVQALSGNGSGRVTLPETLGALWLAGLRTVAATPDSDLHAPWNQGGFLLAPLVIGYGAVTFPALRRGE